MAPEEDELVVLVQQPRNRFVGTTELKNPTLRRFLEMRSWNVDRAAVRLQTRLDWRVLNLPLNLAEVSAILDDRRVVVLDTADSDGRPVFMMNLAKMNKMIWKDEGEMTLHLKACVYCAEQMLAGMPGEHGTWTAIVNCSGTRAPPNSFLTEFTSVMKTNYPETTHKVIMHPIPSAIVMMITAMMVMMPEKKRKHKPSLWIDSSESARRWASRQSRRSTSRRSYLPPRRLFGTMMLLRQRRHAPLARVSPRLGWRRWRRQ